MLRITQSLTFVATKIKDKKRDIKTMNKIARFILEIIINHMLRHQNEFTDLFLGEINVDYHAAQHVTDKDVFLCGWYYFTVKKNKVIFHIAKCEK